MVLYLGLSTALALVVALLALSFALTFLDVVLLFTELLVTADLLSVLLLASLIDLLAADVLCLLLFGFTVVDLEDDELT